MPKRTQDKTKIKSAKITKSKDVEQGNNIKDIFKFGESYTSLILGIIFVVIATVVLLTFVKGKNTNIKIQDTKQEVASESQLLATQEATIKAPNTEQEKLTITPTKTEQKKIAINPTVKPNKAKQNTKVVESTYIVKNGDTLWKIAENKYKSGYNWIDIQKANALTNPSVLHAGNKLILPNVESKAVTVIISDTEGQTITSLTNTNKISGTSYTIAKGDTLWDIAVRAYGDGYAWTKIAKANKLDNPDIIHSGNKLTIPQDKI